MATVVRWEPFRELAALQSEMSRFMNGPTDSNGQATQSWIPTVDVWETDEAVVYAFDLPGVPEDKISIELDDGALTVTAERERAQPVEEGRFARFERRYGTFSRTIGVPQGVTEDGVTAAYEQGVLTVEVAKPEQPKPRKIRIGGSSSSEQKTIEGTASRS
jgi:HSP20 family protein